MRLPITAALICIGFTALASAQAAGGQPIKVSADWGNTLIVSKSTPTLQVVVNPPLRRGQSIHDGSFRAIKAIHARYVRYVPWLPYPRLAVAELEPPTKSGTSWDFSLIDPMTEDFMAAAGGRPTVMNFSTIPEWLFRTPKPVAYPADPDKPVWDYEAGREPRDPTLREIGDYYARLVSWYVNGGFTDENGVFHRSPHHYKFPIWEVLNEVDFEHNTSPELYAREYDAIVGAIHRVSPATKFMGVAMAIPQQKPEYLEYFLNPAHHKPGIPLDYLSYHFYSEPPAGAGPEMWSYVFFEQADNFLSTVRFIELIRKRLSPGTMTDTDEIGVILPGDPGSAANPAPAIPNVYWNAAGAMFAYVYAGLAMQGIDIVGESQLVGYPTQFPSVTMIDWINGKPNARYWVLKLLVDNFHPGDRLVATFKDNSPDIKDQGFATPEGNRILIINKRNRVVEVELPKEALGGRLSVVDAESGEGPPRESTVAGAALSLNPFAVAVLTEPRTR